MARSARTDPPPQEDKVHQPMFSFMGLIKKSGALPGKAIGRSGHPLAIAKGAVLKGLDDQKGYLSLAEKGEALPKTAKGGKTVSTWFTNTPEGYWTAIRYGQLSIPINGETGFLVGTAEELGAFYDAVKEAIRAGEMDTVIGELQKKRSASLTGRTRGSKAA